MTIKPENGDELKNQIKSRQLVLYGMGYVGKLIANWCDEQNIDYIYADRNALELQKQTDKRVVTPEQLASEFIDANVVVASINYFDEVKTALIEIGFSEEQILSFLLFWPKKIDWQELEETADWALVRLRAEKFAKWIDDSSKSVIDYSADKNYLKEFLATDVEYYSPNYIRSENSEVCADFSSINSESTKADVVFCMAILMSFKNPNDVVEHICKVAKKAIILSYVTYEKLPNVDFRRSINYLNDFTEKQIIELIAEKGFKFIKKDIDPFDEVNSVYMFEKIN